MGTRQGRRVRSTVLAGAAAAAGLVLLASSAPARDPEPFAARGGLEAARAGAMAWAADAFLVYVENDEPVGAGGTADRWGYLFYSPARDQARAYSVRGGAIVVAENLDMKFEAPPLAPEWIDSDAALASGDRIAADAFRRSGRTHLSTMLLMRGAFQDQDPDQTTWTLVYTSPGAPSLFVVVDAAQGKVRRTWRG